MATHQKIKLILKILGFTLILYFIVSIAFYMFQDNIIFQSKNLPICYQFKFSEEFEEYFIPTKDGERINAVFFKAPQDSKGLVLYFHGNADNLQRWGKYAVDFTQLGYDVLMIDYRGFGKSTGKSTENNLYSDAQTILQWAQTNVSHARVIFYGRSLGSAVASHLATIFTPDLLILETPFNELKGVVYLPIRPLLYFFPTRYQFSNAIHLQKVSCKKIVIHGTKDWVVPLSSALKLKPLLNQGDNFIIIEGGGHKNLRDFENYHTALKEALK